jgi:5-bromo-4-chloroindolyl phosphate hydrolysis protein
VCLFWGGVQTWLQRLIGKQGAMGMEWGMLLLIAPGVVSVLGTGQALVSALGSFFGLGAVAWFARTHFVRTALLPGQVETLRQDQSDLHLVVNTGRMAKPLEAGAVEMLNLLDAYTQGRQALLPREAAVLVRETGGTVSQLVRYVKRSQPQAWDDEAQNLHKAMTNLCDAMRRTMPAVPALAPQSANAHNDDEGTAAYRSSLAELAAKKVNLPSELHDSVDGICQSAENILECMHKDERDVRPGSRFLSRYLPSVHKVVDEHARLLREGVVSEEISATLAQSGETLVRLREAFAKEHQSLLRNDVTDFSVELGVLDKLLKMDGR